MSNKKWIGAALGLALCSTVLASCSVKNDQSGQATSQNASGSSLNFDDKAEKQLVDAIRSAPANGLKPELFLNSDLPKDSAERHAMLTNAGLRYAEALARGYADPTKLIDVYTIPRPATQDLRQGLAQASHSRTLPFWIAWARPCRRSCVAGRGMV